MLRASCQSFVISIIICETTFVRRRKERGLLDPAKRDPNERYSSLGDKLCAVGRYGHKTGKLRSAFTAVRLCFVAGIRYKCHFCYSCPSFNGRVIMNCCSASATGMHDVGSSALWVTGSILFMTCLWAGSEHVLQLQGRSGARCH